MREETGFQRFARRMASATGRPAAFLTAALVVVIWAACGPLFGFSDTWQLVINTCTTVITFLVVFLIQNTQNRDTEALQLKLDELIRVTKGAHLGLLDLERLTESDVERIRADYERLAREARRDLSRGRPDTGTPPIRGAGEPRRGRRSGTRRNGRARPA